MSWQRRQSPCCRPWWGAADEPADEQADEPADEQADEPADEPVAEPADEPVAEPADEPVAEPADEPVAEPADEPVAEPADECQCRRIYSAGKGVRVLLPEHIGKLLLAESGLTVPEGRLAASPEEATMAAKEVGPAAVVKVQVPAGGRGRAGGVRMVDTPTEASLAAEELLGSSFGGFIVTELLVERRVEHASEHYVAVTDDPLLRTPVLLCAKEGGVEIEELERQVPGSVRSLAVSARGGPERALVTEFVLEAGITEAAEAVADTLLMLWSCYRANDAELVEVNPLAIGADGQPCALDAKVAVDEAALARHENLSRLLAGQRSAPIDGLEAEAAARGFLMVSLGGRIGVVANGAGLTMATLDVVKHRGGSVASCVEIGGDNYTKGAEAVDLLLRDPRVEGLLVNLCGAFARTDVMAEGIVEALEHARRSLPLAFSISGTGSPEARRLVRERLGVEPAKTMEDAIAEIIAAVGGGGR